MNTYEFSQHTRVKLWECTIFTVEAETYEEALKIAKQASEQSLDYCLGCMHKETETVYDGMEILKPEENEGNSTIELYDANGKILFQNAMTITPEIKEQATKYYLSDNFSDFIELFFNGISEDAEGIEFETWTDGGVNMVHYFHASYGSYFMQFRELMSSFDVDEEIDLHRQDERYRQAFKIKESVVDFESYQNYLSEIASLIN